MIATGIDVGATIGIASFDGKVMVAGGDTRSTEEVVAMLMGWADGPPRIVAIEGIEGVYGRSRFGASMATALVKAARQAGELVAVARHAGHLVLEVPAARWRKGLCGKGAASDAQIKAALAPIIGSKRTNAHVRDALGSLDCKDVRIAIGGKFEPVMFRPVYIDGGSGFDGLVMPCKLG